MKNNNVKHDFSYWADYQNVKDFLQANLLLANLRNAGVEIDDDELERLATDGCEYSNVEDYNTEYLQQKLGRYLTPTETEVVEVVMNKLMKIDELFPRKQHLNGYKHYSNTISGEYAKEQHAVIQETLDTLYSLFKKQQEMRFKA